MEPGAPGHGGAVHHPVPLMHQRCRNFANRRHWEQLGAKPSAKFI